MSFVPKVNAITPKEGSFYYNAPIHTILTSPYFAGGEIHPTNKDNDDDIAERKAMRLEREAAAREIRREAYEKRLAENAAIRAVRNVEERAMKMERSRLAQQKAKAEKAAELKRLRGLVPEGFVGTSEIKQLSRNGLNTAINRGYINKRRAGHKWFVELVSVEAYMNRTEKSPKGGTLFGHTGISATKGDSV